MQFIRKRFLFLIFVLCIYIAYFVAHIPHQMPHNVLGAQSNLFLFEEPKDGKEPVLSAIDSATKEVDVEVYLLSDKDVIASLVNACQRGVVVRLMLEEHPFGGGNINKTTQQDLQNTCVQTEWTNPSFSLTHEKTIAIDGNEVFILNQNLTTSSFSKNREYDILDRNQKDIDEIQKIFNADWARNATNLSDENLVVSPVNSRNTLTSLIDSATRNITIEMEVIDDPQIINLLIEKAAKTHIQLILPSFSQLAANKKIAERLSNAHIEIKTLSSPYIHAKLIVSDNKKAYIGSVNLTTQSMDENREVGIVLSQPDVLHELSEDFQSDWQEAAPFP